MLTKHPEEFSRLLYNRVENINLPPSITEGKIKEIDYLQPSLSTY